MCQHAYMTAFHQWFRECPVLGAVLVGVIAGPLTAVGYAYVTLWWVKRDAHPMLFITGPSHLSVLVVGAVVGLFLGIVGGCLYKHYARKP